MKPYEYEQPGCDVQMEIGPNLAGEARVIILSGRPTVYVDVTPDEVPAAALALYEAAGLPEPVILPRPLDLPIGTAEHNAAVAGYYLWLENGRVCLDERRLSSGVEPDSARLLAAAIAVHAEAAETEPDPGDIDELSALIANQRDLNRWTSQDLARSILLGGWKRETGR